MTMGFKGLIIIIINNNTPKLITSSKPFHSLGISLLALQIWHLLTLRAFVNFTYLLTYLLIVRIL